MPVFVTCDRDHNLKPWFVLYFVFLETSRGIKSIKTIVEMSFTSTGSSIFIVVSIESSSFPNISSSIFAYAVLSTFCFRIGSSTCECSRLESLDYSISYSSSLISPGCFFLFFILIFKLLFEFFLFIFNIKLFFLDL